MVRPIFIALTLLLLGCGASSTGPDNSLADALAPCNGAPGLCERQFDQVVYLTTHNAMATQEDGYGGPNHYFGLTQQLEDGVRAWMLDVHEFQGGVSLCHGYCFFGERALGEGLAELRLFLETHPYEVVTLIFESYVTPTALASSFQESGLMEWVYTHSTSEPWPTLREMIDKNERVVVFSNVPDAEYPWQMDVWAHAWETDWNNHQIDDFDCDPNRGDPGNPLFILNHFLTNPIALPSLAESVNGGEILQNRVEECMESSGQLPNFVTIDYYSIGDGLEVVNGLNASFD